MPRRLTCVLCFSILLSLHGSGRADPIQNYVATYTDSLGLNVSTPIALPDLSQGGSVVLGRLPIVVQPAGSTPQVVTPIDGTFTVDIYIQPPAGLPVSGFENITVTGNLQGSITAETGNPPTFTGGLSGAWSSVGFPTGTLYDVPALQALSQHPERIHILGQVITGSSGQSLMQESLVIDPPEIVVPGTTPNPAPIPEPTTLASFLVALSGLALRYHWPFSRGQKRGRT
jgi:hypothetical protein